MLVVRVFLGQVRRVGQVGQLRNKSDTRPRNGLKVLKSYGLEKTERFQRENREFFRGKRALGKIGIMGIVSKLQSTQNTQNTHNTHSTHKNLPEFSLSPP